MLSDQSGCGCKPRGSFPYRERRTKASGSFRKSGASWAPTSEPKAELCIFLFGKNIYNTICHIHHFKYTTHDINDIHDVQPTLPTPLSLPDFPLLQTERATSMEWCRSTRPQAPGSLPQPCCLSDLWAHPPDASSFSLQNVLIKERGDRQLVGS